jgi:hypothetical protein
MLHTEFNYKEVISLHDNTHGWSRFINNATHITSLLLPILLQKYAPKIYKQVIRLELNLAVTNPCLRVRIPINLLRPILYSFQKESCPFVNDPAS